MMGHQKRPGVSEQLPPASEGDGVQVVHRCGPWKAVGIKVVEQQRDGSS
jgi:hypothetical protein